MFNSNSFDPDNMKDLVEACTSREFPSRWVSKGMMSADLGLAVNHLMCPASQTLYHEAYNHAEDAYREALLPLWQEWQREVDWTDRLSNEEIVSAGRDYYEAVGPIQQSYREALAVAFVEAAKIHDQDVRDIDDLVLHET